MPTAQLRCQCLHHPASTGNFWPKHRDTIIPCETFFGGCAHGSHMLTGLDPAFNTVTGIFFFLSLFIFQSLPQEGAIFLLKSQLARCLAQNQLGSIPLEIPHVAEGQEMMDVCPHGAMPLSFLPKSSQVPKDSQASTVKISL